MVEEFGGKVAQNLANGVLKDIYEQSSFRRLLNRDIGKDWQQWRYEISGKYLKKYRKQRKHSAYEGGSAGRSLHGSQDSGYF